jgi:DNA-binding transcriptional LysR family regulator
MLATIDLNLVTAFVSVVETESITRAARALGLPKSSVSRKVMHLEKQLGVELLKRTTRKLSLTEAGRTYFEQAERALSGLEAAAEAAAGLDSEPRGIVRMTAPFDIGVMGLADIIAEFSREYPQVHVEVSLSSLVVNLAESGFDLGVRAGPTEDPTLVSRRVGKTDLGLFASPAYLDAHGRPKSVEELTSHDAVLFHGEHGKAFWRLEDASGLVFGVEVKGQVSADEMLFVRHAVALGMGIGLLPVLTRGKCKQVVEMDPIERVLPELAIRGASLHVVTAAGAKRPRRVTLLRDFLVEKLASRLGV